MNEKFRVMTTSSLRQGRFREEGSEGSQRQICKATNRNVIEGRNSCGELAQRNKASWFREHGKWRVCAETVLDLIWGDLLKGQSVDLWESD